MQAKVILLYNAEMGRLAPYGAMWPLVNNICCKFGHILSSCVAKYDLKNERQLSYDRV